MTLSQSCCSLDTNNLMLISKQPLMTRVNGVKQEEQDDQPTDSDDQGQRVKNQNAPETKSNMIFETGDGGL